MYNHFIMIVLQIRINFLHVGHTHADCDQFFSKISQRILKHGAESLGGQPIIRISPLFDNSYNLHIIISNNESIAHSVNDYQSRLEKTAYICMLSSASC